MSKKKKILVGIAVCLAAVLLWLVVAQKIYYKRLAYLCAHEQISLATFTSMHNAPSREECEGKRLVDLVNGTYQVGNLTFKIPRDYLWENKFVEGPVEIIPMQMYYPSLQPIGDLKTHNDGIDVTVWKCKGKTCADDYPYTYQYVLRRNIERFHPTYSEPRYVPELDMWRIDITDHGKPPENSEFYYRGKQEAPQYWLICNISKRVPYCTGDYWFDKGVSVEVHFQYPFLKEHWRIHQTIDKKLHSFLGRQNHEPEHR